MSSEDELRFLRRVAKSTGVLLDPVYSGKAAFAMTRMLREEPWRFKGKTILFVHTGGQLGAFAKASEIMAATEMPRPVPLTISRMTPRTQPHGRRTRFDGRQTLSPGRRQRKLLMPCPSA